MYDFNQSKAFPENALSISLCIRILWLSVSKAADKSKNNMSEPVLLLRTSSFIRHRAVSVLVRAYKHFGEDEVLLLIDD